MKGLWTEDEGTAGGGWDAKLRIESLLAGVAFVSALATVSNGPRGSLWVKALCALAVVGVVVLVTPSLFRRWIKWRRETRRQALLHGSWSRFALEVSERTRFFILTDSRSLQTLLMALRAEPKDEVGVKRLHFLRQTIQVVSALNGVMLALGQTIAQAWPGAIHAKCIVNAFERLFDFPDSSGLVRELQSQALEPLDSKLIEEWTRYYQGSRADYGRFAKEQNHIIGEKVFGEYFNN